MSKNKSKATHDNETNKLCPFCGEPLYLRQIIPHNRDLGVVFRFLCHNCKFVGHKLITGHYKIEEENEKCIITFIGKKSKD